MLHHDVLPHTIINKKGNLSIKLQTYTQRTALFVALKKSEPREEKDNFRHCHIDEYGLCQKKLETPCLGEALNFSV
jgi:hypothetical protein